jgi:hypothetical protein
MARYLPSYILLAGLLSSAPCTSFAMEERVTLMLTGPACTESHAAINRALEQTIGVRHVDLQAVAGHILVDVETGAMTAEALEDQVNGILATHSSCRAEIMKSCISAAPRPASTRVP